MITSHATNGLSYSEAGKGEAIVFLHGFPHNKELWIKQLESLSSAMHCIAPDIRGFGLSPREGPWTMQQYAQDVFEIIESLGVDKVVLAGLSMGGYIAFECWRRFPERIRAMILMDTHCRPDNDKGKARRDELISIVHSQGVEAISELQLPGMLGKTSRAERPDLVIQMSQMMNSASQYGVAGALAAMRDRSDSRDTVSEITVPVKLICGEEDVLTPPSDLQEIFDLLPSNSRFGLDIVAKAGHVSAIESPTEVNRSILEFIKKLE